MIEAIEDTAKRRCCVALGVDGKVWRLKVVKFRHLGVCFPKSEGRQDCFMKVRLQLNSCGAPVTCELVVRSTFAS